MLGLSTIKNPLIVHIITEIIVLVGVVFWFSSKQKRLQLQIEKLLLRIEDQEDKIFRLENAFEQLYKNMQMVAPTPVSSPAQMVAPTPVSTPAQMVAPTPVSTPAQMVAPTPVSTPYPAFEEINLDQELQEELADLQMEFIPTEQQTTIEQLEEIDTAQSLVEMNNSRSNLDRLKSSVKDLLAADLKKENIQ